MNNYYKNIVFLLISLGSFHLAHTQCSIDLENLRPSCFGDSNGQLIFNLEEVAFPVSATLNGVPYELTTSPWIIDDLPAGIYSAIFSDNQGCTEALEVTVEEATQMDAINLSYSLCSSSTNICDDFETTGGVPPYTMVWDWGPDFESDQFCFPISNQINFTVEIMDAIGLSLIHI